jgi:hypothetical protein
MQVQFWKQWIELQLKHNLDRMVQQSIKNFHFPGLNYVCFDFTPHQTIRLYIIEPKDDLDTTNVQIHNHLYDSQILVLNGAIFNTTYKVNNERSDFNAYHLTSALHPDNKEKIVKLRFLRRLGLDPQQVFHLKAGDTHYQPHTEIHNVTNDPSKYTAFMVFEFPTVKKHSTLFSRKDLGDTIPLPNAYLKYEKEELRELVQNLLNRM